VLSVEDRGWRRSGVVAQGAAVTRQDIKKKRNNRRARRSMKTACKIKGSAGLGDVSEGVYNERSKLLENKGLQMDGSVQQAYNDQTFA
jgi:hypothetical protein